MFLSYNFLKMSILVSGGFMVVAAIIILVFDIMMTIAAQNLPDEDVTNAVKTFILVFFWIMFLLVCSMAFCGIRGAQTGNKVLLILYSVAGICVFLGNISALTQENNEERESGKITQIIFTIIVGIVIVLTCCFTYHPENQESNDKYQRAVNVRDA